jgi:hypothetical protein
VTDPNRNYKNLINSLDDARALYAPPPAQYTGMVGTETEIHVIRTVNGKIVVPGAREIETMQQLLQNKGLPAQLEPAGMLEYPSPAYPLAQVPALAARIKEDVKVFHDTLREKGYQSSPFAIVPTTTMEDAISKLGSRDRLTTSIAVLQDLYPRAALGAPLLISSVQTSFSPKGPDDMFGMMRRAYALTPLLMAACNSCSGFTENNPQRINYFPRAHYYDALGPAGGIADSFLRSTNGTELVDNHIHAVFTVPMYFAYNEDGSLQRATKDNRISFAKLAAQGLNTRSNFDLAESFLYNDVKICNLALGNGDVVGKRLEVRGADNGVHQPVSALLLSAAFVPNVPSAQKFEDVLKDYGFTGSPVQDRELYLSSRKAVVDHGGNFMDVAFGTGRLRDFAADVAHLVVEAYENRMPAAEYAKLTEILMTGECDAKVFAKTLPSLQAANDLLAEGASISKPARVPAFTR